MWRTREIYTSPLLAMEGHILLDFPILGPGTCYLHPSLDIYAQRTNPEATHMTKSGLISALSKKENLAEQKAAEIVSLIFDGLMVLQ